VARSRRPSSMFRGVSRCSKDGRWQARIRVSKSVTYLGRFATEEEAARRYDVAAREHHGDKAILNFPGAADITRGLKTAAPVATAHAALDNAARPTGLRKSSRPAKPKKLLPDEVGDLDDDDQRDDDQRDDDDDST